jgi:hypothetical protein
LFKSLNFPCIFPYLYENGAKTHVFTAEPKCASFGHQKQITFQQFDRKRKQILWCGLQSTGKISINLWEGLSVRERRRQRSSDSALQAIQHMKFICEMYARLAPHTPKGQTKPFLWTTAAADAKRRVAILRRPQPRLVESDVFTELDTYRNCINIFIY